MPIILSTDKPTVRVPVQAEITFVEPNGGGGGRGGEAVDSDLDRVPLVHHLHAIKPSSPLPDQLVLLDVPRLLLALLHGLRRRSCLWRKSGGQNKIEKQVFQQFLCSYRA